MENTFGKVKKRLLHITETEKPHETSTASDQREHWIKQAFWFLVEEYNFRYDGYSEGHSDFVSEKLRIRIEPSRKTPYSYIYRIGEPDFTRLTLFQVLHHYDVKTLDMDLQAHSLEYNLNYLAKLIKPHIHRINNVDEWWLLAHRSRFIAIMKEYSDEGQMDVFLSDHKELYEYLKSKGAM